MTPKKVIIKNFQSPGDNVKPMLKKDHEKKGTKLPDDYNYLYFDDDEDRWITIYWGA
jgi:hypothetical protein